MVLKPFYTRATVLTFDPSGVIPRAAGALFEKLADPTVLRRNGLSNLKIPTRYSTSFTHSPQTVGRGNEERNWQMKATYVEVLFCVL